MADAYDLVLELTEDRTPPTPPNRALRDFARELGWRPSYNVTGEGQAHSAATAHLVVEHGLEPSAVITFLRRSHRLAELPTADLNSFLSISYNNLVDWHLYVEPDRVTFCFNRSDSPIVETRPLSRSNFDSLRNDSFDKIIGRRPNPNMPALDDALIQTISLWKRNLGIELDQDIPNETLSALFNAILFTRAIEDYTLSGIPNHPDTLAGSWQNVVGPKTITNVIASAVEQLNLGPLPQWVVNYDALGYFDRLNERTLFALISDFYRNRYTPYRYDFSVMSKHALSRVYEHYVSLLKIPEQNHPSLFPLPPMEQRNLAYGSIYTPQFIARFFARFLKEHHTPNSFRTLRSVDPAVGSGIFLRTVLEYQCDPLQDGITSAAISQAFDGALGLDIDVNAAQAARLSLGLLYLVLTGRLPDKVPILTAEAIEYFQTHEELKGAFDAILVNPPFIALGAQGPELRRRLADFLGPDASGRPDTYLAFLKLGLETLKPGGFGLYVLPHSFLIADSAKGMREKLSQEAWIHCIADLSAIRVFGDVGSYVALVVFQKKRHGEQTGPDAAILKCTDYVGQALEDYLDGKFLETSTYSIHRTLQDDFREDRWVLLPPTEASLKRRLSYLPSLGDFVHIREGIITGADDVFIVSETTIPAGEGAIFVPFLPDRLMERFSVPASTSRFVFYPYQDGIRLDEAAVRERFPQTWSYLESHRTALESRRSVKNTGLKWWEPVRPRPPERLLRPKIVSPHLLILPKFGLDREGKYATSHGPLMYPKQPIVEDDLLLFLTAVLNSTVCYWHISNHSHKYSRGYSMLEPKTLRSIPVPDIAAIPAMALRQILQLVERILEGSGSPEDEKALDQMVCDLYGLTESERTTLGLF